MDPWTGPDRTVRTDTCQSSLEEKQRDVLVSTSISLASCRIFSVVTKVADHRYVDMELHRPMCSSGCLTSNDDSPHDLRHTFVFFAHVEIVVS